MQQNHNKNLALNNKNQPIRGGGGFCRAMLCVSAAYAVARCLPVCLSVTFVYSVDTNKHNYFQKFSQSDGHTILVFPYQTYGHIPLNWTKIAIFEYLALASITAGPSRVVRLLPSTNATAPCISES